MADIAQAAGVSITTVSHVINKTRPVGRETERAVLAAIAATGYVPDSVLRAQRSSGPQIIGVAISSITNPHFGEVAAAIEQTAADHGYSIVLSDTHDDVAGEMRAVNTLLSRHVEAIILAPSVEPSEVLRQTKARGVPVVLVDRMISHPIDQIGAENSEPTAQLVDHLAGLGHRRIAIISGRRGISTTEERISGYREGLQRNDIPVDDYLIGLGDGRVDRAREAMLGLAALPEPPTAFVVGNNQMTIGAMQGLRDLNLRVPDDVALVAFDDLLWADICAPRMTVIAQPTQVIGSEAAQMALSRIANPDLPARKVLLQPRFVHRDSCGCHSPAVTT